MKEQDGKFQALADTNVYSFYPVKNTLMVFSNLWFSSWHFLTTISGILRGLRHISAGVRVCDSVSLPIQSVSQTMKRIGQTDPGFTHYCVDKNIITAGRLSGYFIRTVSTHFSRGQSFPPLFMQLQCRQSCHTYELQE